MEKYRCSFFKTAKNYGIINALCMNVYRVCDNLSLNIYIHYK